MGSRWQMIAAGVSVAVMIVVLVKYGMRDEPPPANTPAPAPRPELSKTPLGGTLGSAGTEVNEPHQGAEHHTAEAPPHEGGKPAPVEAYANSKLGDWLAYESVMETSATPKPVTVITLAKITAVDDKQITRTSSGPGDSTTEDETFPRQGLTLDQLTGNAARGWTIHDVAVTDEAHEVGGRSFKAKKITFASRKTDDPNRRIRTEMWISDEVPAGGLVEYRDVHEGADFKLTRRLIGFGDAKKTRWGTKPADAPGTKAMTGTKAATPTPARPTPAAPKPAAPKPATPKPTPAPAAGSGSAADSGSAL